MFLFRYGCVPEDLVTVCIIVVCHCSSTVMKLMGMRNIEILATLFLLSYTKLLKTIIIALSLAATISFPDNSDFLTYEYVWLYDAQITYMGLKHLPLSIVVILCLALLILPYTMLLLFGQCLVYVPNGKGLRWIHNPKLNSILDAYHAPYK